jgi:membrane protease YdiL (CAAX protease family)
VVALCGVFAALADLLLCFWVDGFVYSWTRAILPLAALLIISGQRGAKPGKGWPSRHPYGGWRLWAKVSLIVTAWALLFWGALFWVSSLIPWAPHLPQLNPQELPNLMLYACLLAPLLEEGVYRLLLCTALATRFRHRTVIFISGTLFALLHYAYGNLALTNAVAGYLLAWVYLMSSSVWLTMLWHSFGNLMILLAEVFLFHLAAG